MAFSNQTLSQVSFANTQAKRLRTFVLGGRNEKTELYIHKQLGTEVLP